MIKKVICSLFKKKRNNFGDDIWLCTPRSEEGKKSGNLFSIHLAIKNN